MKKNFLIATVAILLSFNLKAQTTFTELIGDRINDFLVNNIQEKIYVQTNANEYTIGDTLWFKSTIVNAITHTPSQGEKLMYIDLVSPENKTVQHQVFYIFGGFTAGCLLIKNNLNSGTYKLIAYTNYMKNYSTDFFFQKNIVVQKQASEKEVWEFSPKIVACKDGDSVSVSMAVTPAMGKEINSDATVSVQLAKGSILGGTAKISGNVGKFNFFVPDSLRVPQATLSISLPYKDNVTERYKIELSAKQPDLQFLPESGNLMPGINNLVAFKCVDVAGVPLDVSGKIYDKHHELVSSFSTVYQGMGSINLYPSDSSEYTAEINWKGQTYTYLLPKPSHKGYGFHLVQNTVDSLTFEIFKPDESAETITLSGHIRGAIYFIISGKMEGRKMEISVPKVDFPTGIATFTLFARNYPRAERLVFIERDDQLSISITPNKQSYGKRDKVELNLHIADPYGNPVVGSFSLNAVDAVTGPSLDEFENIQNYLLFSSDLKGAIMNVDGYFDKTNPDLLRNRDLLMLTNGWRRFEWNEIYYAGEKTKLKYEIEKELSLTGEVKRPTTNKPAPKNIEVTVSLKQKKPILIDKTKTDKMGEFGFPLPEFSDSAMLTIQTRNRLGRQQNYKIDLQSNLERKSLNHLSFEKISSLPVSSVVSYTLGETQEETEGEVPLWSKKVEKRKDNYYFPGKDTFLISEVEVKSDFLSQRDSLINQTGEPDVVIESAQLKRIVEQTPWYSSIWDLLENQIPGLRIEERPYDSVLADKSNLIIKEPGNYAIYFFVNDNPDGRLRIKVDGEFIDNRSIQPYETLSNMNPSDIESVNFFSKPKNYENSQYDPSNPLSNTEIYNENDKNLLEELPQEDYLSDDTKIPRNSNNINTMRKEMRYVAPPSYLYITTKSKKGLFYEQPKGIATLYLNGFTNYKVYYSPKYENVNSNSNLKYDDRKTIHWDPNIVTNDMGNATVSFYTSDQENPISVLVQGIALNGLTGATSFELNKKQTPDAPQTPVAEKKNASKDAINIDPALFINGLIVDKTTQTPLTSAGITQQAPFYHVSSNREGEFLIERSQLAKDAMLMVSCPNYKDFNLTPEMLKASSLTIELEKAPLMPSQAKEPAKSIVKEAIRKSGKYNNNEQVFQGYFREAFLINNNAYGVYESAFAYTNQGNSGVTKSILYETEKFKNMEDKNGHKLQTLKPNHHSLFYPVKTDVLSFAPGFWDFSMVANYQYEIQGEVEYKGKTCYKIFFSPSETIVQPLEQGTMLIDKESLALLYAQWEIAPGFRQYFSYTRYLHSNPMNYNISVSETHSEASYCLTGGKLVLESASEQVDLLVNNSDQIEFDRQLSINGESPKTKKFVINSTFDTLLENGKGKHILVKDAKYQIKPWLTLGVIKPESYLINDAKFMHDVTLYR